MQTRDLFKLVKMGACTSGREWASEYVTIKDAWDDCIRPDWLIWWHVHTIGSCDPLLRLVMRYVTNEKILNLYDQYWHGPFSTEGLLALTDALTPKPWDLDYSRKMCEAMSVEALYYFDQPLILYHTVDTFFYCKRLPAQELCNQIRELCSFSMEES